MADSDTGVLGSSSFYKEIIQLPVIKSAEELYRCTKGSSRVLNTGLTVLEYSVSTALDKVFTGSNIAMRVDSMVGKGVSKLKEKYPSLQTTPKEIGECTLHSVQDKVRNVMRTGPGQAVLLCLDWALDTSEGILKRIRSRDKRLRRRKTTKCTLQKEEVTKDQFHMSEENSVSDREDDSTQGDRCQQTFLSVKHGELYADVSLLERAYWHILVYPMEVLVKVLRALRQFARDLEWSVEAFTTEVENGTRRTISPSKSVSFSFLRSVKQGTDKLLEYRHISSTVLGKDGSDGSPDRDEGEKERKHDDILTDDGSEVMENFDIDNDDSDTEEDLANFDFDSYDSENDPDYLPNSAEESSQSDTEEEEEVSASDAESEFVNIDLVQLKDKNDLKSGSEATQKPSEDLESSSRTEAIPSEDIESLNTSEAVPRPSEDLESLNTSEAVPRPSEDLESSNTSEAVPRPSEDLDNSGTPVDNRDNSLLKRLSQKSPTKLIRDSLKNVYHVCI